MRILIAGLNFYPELTGIGRYSGEMAQFLARQGHEVRAITSPPYYPAWRIAQHYSGWRYQTETWHGIKIIRCPLWVPRKPSGLKRLLHLFSYALSSFPALLGQLFWRPEVILCIAPTFFSAPFAWLTARLSGAKCWLHIQDFELDAATNLQMLSSTNLLVKLAARWEAWMFSRFDRVSTISQRMMERLEEKGVDPKRITLFPNWVNTQAIYPLTKTDNTYRIELKIAKEQMIVLYSGSMGAKQGLDDLVRTAQRLEENTDIIFVFCGEGAGRDELIKAAKGLSNVKHLALQPVEKLNSLLNTADIHIMLQKANAADLVMPSKLSGMLASGKAVIATAHPNTEVGHVVSEVGILVQPEDPPALSEAIIRLTRLPLERAELGKKGREYAVRNWDTDIVLTQFEQRLQELVKED